MNKLEGQRLKLQLRHGDHVEGDDVEDLQRGVLPHRGQQPPVLRHGHGDERAHVGPEVLDELDALASGNACGASQLYSGPPSEGSDKNEGFVVGGSCLPGQHGQLNRPSWSGLPGLLWET